MRPARGAWVTVVSIIGDHLANVDAPREGRMGYSRVSAIGLRLLDDAPREGRMGYSNTSDYVGGVVFRCAPRGAHGLQLQGASSR